MTKMKDKLIAASPCPFLAKKVSGAMAWLAPWRFGPYMGWMEGCGGGWTGVYEGEPRCPVQGRGGTTVVGIEKDTAKWC